MEDILEELVGEIWDEHDEVDEPIRQVGEYTFIVDGTVSMSTFCDTFDVETDSESVCVGGWVMDEMERIPNEGEQFCYGHLTITMVNVEDHRVATVQVTVGDVEHQIA